MKISKTLLGVVITVVLLAGWQKSSKAEEGTEAAKEAQVMAAPAQIVEAPVAAVEVTAPAAVEVTAPAAVEVTAPAAVEVTAPAAVEVTAPAAVEVTAPKSTENASAIISIAELFAKKAELSGKSVTIFGKVVKLNKGVMGKNWLHIQDGTGTTGSNDITITTAGTANPNDKVSVSGILTLDKDFGAGYKYEVIIEDATVIAQ